MIDRISAAIDSRERFEVPLPEEVVRTGSIVGLHVAGNGDLYARLGVVGDDQTPSSNLIARLRLPD